MCTNEWRSLDSMFNIFAQYDMCHDCGLWCDFKLLPSSFLNGASRILSRTWTHNCHIRYRYLLAFHPSDIHRSTTWSIHIELPLARGVTSCSHNLVPYLHTHTSLWCPRPPNNNLQFWLVNHEKLKNNNKIWKVPQNRSFYVKM
jgi:hypothetical protein